MLIPPGRREDVGTIRVDIRHVGAWWPARFEAAEGDEAPDAGGEARPAGGEARPA